MELVEKSCEATRELSTCVNESQCETEEMKRLLVNFPQKESNKAFYKCCCEKAYQCKKPNQKCSDTVNDMAPKDTAKLEEHMTTYKEQPTKKNAKKALKAIAAVGILFQFERDANDTKNTRNPQVNEPIETMPCQGKVGYVLAQDFTALLCHLSFLHSYLFPCQKLYKFRH